MELKLISVHNRELVKNIWNSNLSQNNSSYFLSWSWIENWLLSLPKKVDVKLAFISEDGSPLATFFIGKRKQFRRGFIPVNGYFVNGTGYEEIDRPLWIEYNRILRSDNMGITLESIINFLPNSWDEIYLPGLDCNSFPADSIPERQEKNDYSIIIERVVPSYYVELNLLRNDYSDYLSLLSKNTRSVIKRAYKGYSHLGKICLESAVSKERALEIFEELFGIHQDTFRKKDVKSNFATQFSKFFHQRLINNYYEQGEIQLLRITCGDNVIGCLYNFVYKGQVYFYQSGLVHPNDNRLKPGYICHFEAIKHNAELQHKYYDFLPGNERYKRSFSTNKSENIWVKIQKRRVQFRFEHKLLRCFARIKHHLIRYRGV